MYANVIPAARRAVRPERPELFRTDGGSQVTSEASEPADSP